MKKVLFLPFLQIPSGHHQAADAMIAQIEQANPHIHCEKVDLFSYSYGKLETIISRFYLRWIHMLPNSYSMLYKKMVVDQLHKEKDFYLYELLFQHQLEQLIQKKQPDCIVSTHALPSRILSKLKQSGKIEIPIYNVYTDFFIHKGWGIKHIDGHFISTSKMQNFLLSKEINKNKIYFTGIPIHPMINRKPIIPEPPRKKINVLISGGSMGAGSIETLIKKLSNNKLFHYFILCGRNHTLYSRIKQKNEPHLTPVPYIHSRKIMDLIYNSADIIVTKPGGVTISECLQKRIPIFIYHKLPGQEEVNYEELKEQQLVNDILNWRETYGLTEEILDFVHSPSKISQYFHHLYQYEKNKIIDDPAQILLEQLS